MTRPHRTRQDEAKIAHATGRRAGGMTHDGAKSIALGTEEGSKRARPRHCCSSECVLSEGGSEGSWEIVGCGVASAPDERDVCSRFV
jgi:hypothetical protein